MKGLIGVLLLLAVLSSAICWMLGYREGQQAGAFRLVHDLGVSYDRDVKNQKDIDRDDVCNEIRHYKLAVARDLDENTEICGWRDMDEVR